MLNAKYQQIGPVVLEKKSFEWILPNMVMTANLNFLSWPF